MMVLISDTLFYILYSLSKWTTIAAAIKVTFIKTNKPVIKDTPVINIDINVPITEMK